VRTPRVLVFVDESNVVSSVRALGRKLDWLKLRDHLASADRGRELIEMVVYAGLPPPIPEWQTEREKKNKFLHWLRSNGFLVVAKDGTAVCDYVVLGSHRIESRQNCGVFPYGVTFAHRVWSSAYAASSPSATDGCFTLPAAKRSPANP
jgi:hypothetical protein